VVVVGWRLGSAQVLGQSGWVMSGWWRLSVFRNLSATLMTFLLLPQAVLAAVIIVNLKGMMKQFSDICSLWKANRVDLVRSLGA
jgi:hypothetical protein